MNSERSITWLHRLRRWANAGLGGLGFALVRSGTPLWRRGAKVVDTTIGRFHLQVPSSNPLSTLYSRHPQTSAYIGRLAGVLLKKYPQLAGIDIGANVGDTAAIIKTAADIPLICIEGDDYTFGFLEKNLAGLRAVTGHQRLLGERTGTIQATIEKSGWNLTIKPEQTAGSQPLEMITLDDFLAGRPGLEKIKLLKIDTEGFDCAILRGALKFIRQSRPAITFEYNRENMDAIGEKGLDTLTQLGDLGYHHAVLHDPYGRFICAATLENAELIRDLHEYADGRNGNIYYYDITLLHAEDADVAQVFVAGERRLRAATSTLAT